MATELLIREYNEIADNTAIEQSKKSEVNDEQLIMKALDTLEFDADTKGYIFLVEIIKSGLKDINNIIPIIQKGYPNVARIFETTPIRVERAIRNAIETAIICGNLETWNYVFGNSYSALKGKPTNTKFIITLVEYLKSLIKVPKSITESTSINEKSIAKTLKLLGISTKRKGYKYLIEFIKLGVNDFNSVSTFEIGCFNVAKGFNTTTKSVASCIRLAVKQSNDSVEFVDPETWNKIFGNSHLKGHVSNAEFIRALINFFVK